MVDAFVRAIVPQDPGSSASAFQLWRRDGCRHLPQVIGPEGLAFCASAFQRGCLFCVDAHGMEAAALFCYCELVFYSLKVIFGPAHMYALGCVRFRLRLPDAIRTAQHACTQIAIRLCVDLCDSACVVWVLHLGCRDHCTG